MKVTKDMSIFDVVQRYPYTAEIFFYAGMGCFGCHAARFENIEQGCLVHGIDPDELVAAINEVIEAEENAPAAEPVAAN